MNTLRKINFRFIPSLLFLMVVASCGTDWLDEQPLTSISSATFWKSESDAILALNGVYTSSTVGDNGYNNLLLCYTSKIGDGAYKEAAHGDVYTGFFTPTDWEVARIWNMCYTAIYRSNYFLENIEAVEMDEALKAQFIAEVRFIRAYEYFYLRLWFGDVPLVTKVLTIEEANTQTRNPLEEVANYAISELTEAAKDLPATRPDNERGRILKSAALAAKGRLLLMHKRWAEAVSTYQEIINLNAHVIDPQYKAMFEEAGSKSSKEIVLSTSCITGLRPNPQNQTNYHPEMYGGYEETVPTQSIVDAYLMNDGLPIEESPLYDPANPFENRDPRLYATIFLPFYTVFRGELYDNRSLRSINVTGYSWKKYVTEDFLGVPHDSGEDIILLRYAEVLLSYLEAKLENGDAITQELLDQTINQVRSREEVQMPAVTETDPAKLREIVRRERRVEFCFERIVRYMDVMRWGLFPDIANQKVYGMKLTDDPENYTEFLVETVGKYRGHYINIDNTGQFTTDHIFLPLPQFEIDINPNLKQNPGYN